MRVVAGISATLFCEDDVRFQTGLEAMLYRKLNEEVSRIGIRNL